MVNQFYPFFYESLSFGSIHTRYLTVSHIERNIFKLKTSLLIFGERLLEKARIKFQEIARCQVGRQVVKE